MICFDRAFVERAIPEAEILYDAFTDPSNVTVSVDSRTLVPGELFVAIDGAQVDGHSFVAQAVACGAGGIIVAQDKRSCLDEISQEALANIAVIIVPDTTRALQQCARAWRAQFDIPIVGITGSAGKTTTREMLVSILTAANFAVIGTKKNYNSTIGLPMSILTLREHHTVAVFEVGIAECGEMELLADILRPTIGIITNIGHAHLAGLGSISGVAREKKALFTHFRDTDIGIINGDVPQLTSGGYAHPTIKFGTRRAHQFHVRRVQSVGEQLSCSLSLFGKQFKIKLPQYHIGLVYSALAACAAAAWLGVPEAMAVEAVLAAPTMRGRFQRLEFKNRSGYIINDAYNANPESVKASLDAFERCQTTGKKVVVLGDMLELGDSSVLLHRRIGRFLHKLSTIDTLILVGDAVKAVQDTAPADLNVYRVQSVDEAKSIIENFDATEELLLLVKASGGMGLQKLVDALASQDKLFAGARSAGTDSASLTAPQDKHLPAKRSTL